MEYIEMTTAQKGIFENIIPSDGLRVPFSTNVPMGAGFRPASLPVFTHGKPHSSAGAPVPPTASCPELSKRGSIPLFATTGINSPRFPLVTSGNGSMGTLHAQVPGESGSSLQGDGLMEKGKRIRGGGASSRKRTKGGQSDSLTTSEAMPDRSLSGGAVPSSTGNGARQCYNSSGEKGEKSTCRRQSGQSAKRGDKKQATVATSVNDFVTAKLAEANGVQNGWSSGILDIYGLRTRKMDVSGFMADIPLDDLLSGKFEVPSFTLTDKHGKDFEDGFKQQIGGVLHLLPKPLIMGEAHSSKHGDSLGNLSAKGLKMILDLESPLLPDEDGVPRMAKTEKDMQCGLEPLMKLEVQPVADKEIRMDMTTALTDGLFLQSPSRFALDGLPLHPVEDFLSRLKLSPSDPLQSLISQVGADGENGSAASLTSRDVIDLCHRNGSVPPLPFSYPPVGPLKVENGRYIQRIWIQESSGGKNGHGLIGKEVLNGGEDDWTEKSSSPRQRKFDSKVKVFSPGAMQISTPETQSSGQMDPTRASSLVDPITVKEEPRHVENTVGFSLGQNLKPIEMDSGRVDNGSIAACGADRTESTLVLNYMCDKQRGDGEAARPLETTATLAVEQEMDFSSDWQGKLLAKTVAEVKQEKVELALKDFCRDSSHEPSASKHELSLTMDTLDFKVSLRVNSPPKTDSSSSLPALPSSPGAQAAARLLCSIANSTYLPDIDKIDGDKDKRRRVFQPYPGAPFQKITKSIRVSNSACVPKDAAREGRNSVDGGPVSPCKAPVSERRKSLSQVNDAPEKPSHLPRTVSSSGISTGPRGNTHLGSRLSNLTVKLEKVAHRDSMKDSLSSKDFVARVSSLPSVSNVAPALKNSHKGVKNSYIHSSNSKGSVSTGNFAKVPAACTTQRVVTGGTSSRSSRTIHTGSNLALHGPATASLKSSRQGISESRQKTKADLSARGAKPN